MISWLFFCFLYYLTLELRVFTAVGILTFQKIILYLLEIAMRVQTKAFFVLITSLVCLIVTANEAFFTVNENHRRRSGVFSKSMGATSLVLCGLACLHNPRCVATNFRKNNHDCELLDFDPSEVSSGLEYVEDWIFTQSLKVKILR